MRPRKTQAERRATHKKLYGNTSLPERKYKNQKDRDSQLKALRNKVKK